MPSSIILTGDINLMGVEDVTVPFRRVTDTLKKADCVFGNLECCLYDPPVPRVMMPDERSGYDGFFAPTATGPALVHGGFHCVGNANNQNYGTDAILVDNARPGSGVRFDWSLLDELPSGLRVMLSGGLDPDNVREAILTTQPWGVDVSSGVEREPGVKDAVKMRRFITAARDAQVVLGDDLID